MSNALNQVTPTPGPWEVSAQNGCHADEEVFGIVGPMQTNSRGKTYRFYVAQYVQKHNAAMIAATPELFQLLKDFCDSLGDADTIPTQRQAYIKKAAQALFSTF